MRIWSNWWEKFRQSIAVDVKEKDNDKSITFCHVNYVMEVVVLNVIIVMDQDLIFILEADSKLEMRLFLTIISKINVDIVREKDIFSNVRNAKANRSLSMERKVLLVNIANKTN